MTSKRSFTDGLLAVWRTQLGAQRILLLLFGFIFTVLPALAVMNILNNPWTQEHTYSFVSNLWTALLVFGMLPMLLFALLMGISQFSYLHKRQRLDFFHALPVTREQQYGGRVLAAVTAFFGGALLMALSTFLSTMAVLDQTYSQTLQPIASGTVFSVALTVFLSSVACYLLTALIMSLTANFWEMIYSLGVVSAVVPASVLFVYWLVHESIPMNDFDLSGRAVSYFSPFLTGLYALITGRTAPNEAVRVPLVPTLVTLLQIAVCFGLGLWFFKKRPSELAESTQPTGFKKLITVLTTELAAFLGGFILFYSAGSMFNREYPTYLVGCVVSAVIACFVLELLYNRTVKKIKKRVKWCVTGFALFVVLNLLVVFGLVGVPRVPEADSITAVRVSFHHTEFEPSEEEGGEDTVIYLNSRTGSHKSLYDENGWYDVMDGSTAPADIGSACSLLEKLVAEQKKEYFPYIPRSGISTYGSNGYTYFYLNFYSNNGDMQYYAYDLILWDKAKGDPGDIYRSAEALINSPTYTIDGLMEQCIDNLTGITEWEFESGLETEASLQYMNNQMDIDSVIPRLKEALRRDMEKVATSSDKTDDTATYFDLTYRADIPYTVKGGLIRDEDGIVQDGAGFTGWLSPDYVPTSNADRAQSVTYYSGNIMDSIFYGEYPNLYNELVKIFEEQGAYAPQE